MKSVWICVVLVAVLAVPSVEAAEAGERFRFELLDGTTIDGTINELEQLTVKTAYGTLRIPIAGLVGFSPGLDSRPDLAEKLDVLIRLLVSPEKKERETAQAGLIKLGPTVRPMIEALAKDGDPDPEYKARRKAILDAYAKWVSDHPDETVRPLRKGPDSVKTALFSGMGRVADEAFTITSEYAQVRVKLSDIWRVQRAAPRVALARKDLIIVLDLLDGSRLRGKTEQKALSLATAYGKLTLPLERIGTAHFGKNAKETRVQMLSGERLKGAAEPDAALNITTILGVVRVPLAKAARLGATSDALWRGLAAFWPAEGNANDLLGRHNGKIRGRVKFAPGRSGKAFVFDGRSGHVAIPNQPGIRITGDQTIAMWIKPDRLGIRQNPLAKAYGGECTITLEESGALNYYYGTSGRNGPPYNGYTSAEPRVKAGQWAHIAVVRDLKAMKVTWYVNGVAAGVTPARHPAAKASNAPLYLGRGYVRPFDGLIDEVGLWKRALAPAEVAALCWNGPRPPEPTEK